MRNLFFKKKQQTDNMEKVFVNRDLGAEVAFYNGNYSIAIAAANKWIIPLMHKFEMPVSISDINNIMATGIRDTFIDEIVRKRANGTIWPSDWKRYQADAEHYFSAALLEVIENGQRIKMFEAEYERCLADYQARINTAIDERNNTRYDADITELNHKISSLNASISKMEASHSGNRKEVIEDEKRDFENMVEAKPVLGMALDYLKIENGILVYDKEKVEKHFAVYAETEQEIKLIEKVKQLSALINEVYGNQFGAIQESFYLFFSVSNGRVIINPELQKGTIQKYAKNL